MKLFRKRWEVHTPYLFENPEAQAYFDQGFQLMYAFGKLDAARSFREAEKRDPDCAICYWERPGPGFLSQRPDATV